MTIDKDLSPEHIATLPPSHRNVWLAACERRPCPLCGAILYSADDVNWQHAYIDDRAACIKLARTAADLWEGHSDVIAMIESQLSADGTPAQFRF